MENFSFRLKAIRTENHLTQKQLADSVSLSARQIIRYEQGIQEPTVSIASKIAD